MIRVVIVDDHPSVRQAMIASVSDEPDVEVVAEYGSAEQLLRSVEDEAPDVAIIELRLPGIDGNHACRLLREQHPQVRAVVASSVTNEATILEAFAAGARGFVVKEPKPVLFRHAVRSVADGGRYVDPRIAGKIINLALMGQRAKGPFGLTLQELRVLERLPKGRTNQEIADELGITVSTVKKHVGNILDKLDSGDRSEAAAVALRHGLA